MKRSAACVSILVCVLLLVSCGKKYVGLQVGYPEDNWCDYYPGYYPSFGEGKQCKLSDGNFTFDFIIKKGDGERDYVVEGFIDASQGSIKSFDRLMEGPSRFFMLVAYGNKIVDNVSFRPRTMFGGLGKKMPFRIEYHSDKGFDKITLGYDVTIRG